MAGGEEAVDVPEGVLQAFRVVAPVAVVDALDEMMLLPFAQNLARQAVAVGGVLLQQIDEERHFRGHFFHG